MAGRRGLAVAACTALVLSAPALAGPALPAQKTTILSGTKILDHESGSGPTVVLVHGLGSSANGTGTR